MYGAQDVGACTATVPLWNVSQRRDAIGYHQTRIQDILP